MGHLCQLVPAREQPLSTALRMQGVRFLPWPERGDVEPFAAALAAAATLASPATPALAAPFTAATASATASSAPA